MRLLIALAALLLAPFAQAQSDGPVVFMGDSITFGWANQPWFKGNPRFVGRGISGETAKVMLRRFERDVIALRPAVVHIMAGTNDVAQNGGPETPDEIVGYITSMAELARAKGIRVVLASIPPAKRFGWRPAVEPAGQIRALNKRLKAWAGRHHIAYADYWRVLATPDGAMKPEYSGDGVHPGPAGYAVMAPVADAAMGKALRRR